MDCGRLSPAGSRSPMNSSNSSCPDPTSTPVTGDDYGDIQRPLRACEYCRQHKVRCDIGLRDASGSCGRCLKANRECVSGSYSRKRRKTTDSRVLDLETKVEMLTSRFEKLERKSQNGNGEQKPATDHQNRGEGDTPMLPTLVVQPPDAIQLDVIDRQILSIELAGRIFQHYTTEVSSVIPAVVFSPGTASSDIRRHKPILFLAILVAASGRFDDSLQERLHSELLKLISDRIICRGLKSLEVIQALVVMVLWYHPSEAIAGGRLNQLIHIAAMMASDISITGGHSNRRAPLDLSVDTSAKGESQLNGQSPAGSGWPFVVFSANPDAYLPESRRALLACYFLCSNIARRLRRPNVFPFTSYISECIEYFETSTDPGVFATDKSFVQWIKISNMVEEFSIASVPSDPSDPSTSEYRVKMAMEHFLDRMTKWRQTAGGVMTHSLDLFARGSTKHMYDLILNSEYRGDEFRPLALEILVSRAQRGLGPSPTEFRADVVRACLGSVHICLDLFLTSSPSFARSLPGLFYVEAGYTIGLLLKISLVAALSSSTLDTSQIKFGDYVERVLAFLSLVTEQNKRHAAERLRLIMVGLKNWVDTHQKANETSGLVPKGPVQPFEDPTPSPLPAQQAYLTSHLTSPRGDVDVGLPFVGYVDAGRDEAGDGVMQEMEGDPMLWDSFPLTEFLQFDGIPDLYSPWG